ncbi:MAG: tRNA pseudouridine(55) synthase TruB [Bacilli bacterium]|nr:tRNA pseudouridine(55) synthase TruB [Bacilli bacterium]
MITGALLINKEKGRTSRQEVNTVSKLLHEKKMGHIGTLDPFAEGLLIVLAGRATKIAPFIEQLDKTYLAKLKLGQKTDTGDKDGAVVEEVKVPNLDINKINKILQRFLGKSLQTPPKYSALKVNGERAYALARKNVDFELKQREIEVFEIGLVNFNGTDEITFICRVSKGTYVRTLAEDIAAKLGCVGHLVELTRVKIGKYSLENSVKASYAKAEKLISVDEMLKDFPTEFVSGEDAKKAKNGVSLCFVKQKEKLVVVKDEEGPIAMYELQSGKVYHCLRGLR